MSAGIANRVEADPSFDWQSHSGYMLATGTDYNGYAFLSSGFSPNNTYLSVSGAEQDPAYGYSIPQSYAIFNASPSFLSAYADSSPYSSFSQTAAIGSSDDLLGSPASSIFRVNERSFFNVQWRMFLGSVFGESVSIDLELLNLESGLSLFSLSVQDQTVIDGSNVGTIVVEPGIDYVLRYQLFAKDFGKADFSVDLQVIPSPGILAVFGIAGATLSTRRRR